LTFFGALEGQCDDTAVCDNVIVSEKSEAEYLIKNNSLQN